MGPILIFDKSFLESLNIDESVWLEQFFVTNLTPTFYIETLSDLSKNSNPKRSPEKLVSDLANKTPTQHIYPNIFAGKLVIDELRGGKIKMINKPLIETSQIGHTSRGEKLQKIKPSFEEDALNRWQQHEFKTLEKIFSLRWRNSASMLIDPNRISLIQNITPRGKKLSNLGDIYKFVNQFIKHEDLNILYLVQEILHIPPKLIKLAENRWQLTKAKSLKEFAPYTAYIMSVELLFYISIIKGFISKDRSSNRIDMVYLHYLPFTQIFVSSDNLHERVIHFFLDKKQTFIKGPELKEGLSELNSYFDKLPPDIKDKGVISFAELPTDLPNVICLLWDKYLPGWREKKDNIELTQKEKRELIEKLKRLKDEELLVDEPNNEYEADEVIKPFKVRLKKGKWNMLPPEARSRK